MNALGQSRFARHSIRPPPRSGGQTQAPKKLPVALHRCSLRCPSGHTQLWDSSGVHVRFFPGQPSPKTTQPRRTEHRRLELLGGITGPTLSWRGTLLTPVAQPPLITDNPPRQRKHGWCRPRSSKPMGVLRSRASAGSIPVRCRRRAPCRFSKYGRKTPAPAGAGVRGRAQTHGTTGEDYSVPSVAAGASPASAGGSPQPPSIISLTIQLPSRFTRSSPLFHL